jgi:hypothetical protein
VQSWSQDGAAGARRQRRLPDEAADQKQRDANKNTNGHAEKDTDGHTLKEANNYQRTTPQFSDKSTSRRHG